jgi:hypothetical protein
MTPETYAKILVQIIATAGTKPENIATCGTCGFRWDDSIPTELTPAPSGRCPNEYNHAEPQPHAGERRAWTDSDIPDGALDRALGDTQRTAFEQWDDAVMYAHSAERETHPLLTLAMLITAGDRLRDELREMGEMEYGGE